MNKSLAEKKSMLIEAFELSCKDKIGPWENFDSLWRLENFKNRNEAIHYCAKKLSVESNDIPNENRRHMVLDFLVLALLQLKNP